MGMLEGGVEIYIKPIDKLNGTDMTGVFLFSKQI